MKVLFYFCILLIAFTYAGYPVWLYFRARFWPRPVRRADIAPTISILLAARNEEINLVEKLQCLDRLDYPASQLEVLVVSDGSTDGTNRILSLWERADHRAIILPEHRGKAVALNSGLAVARGEIVVFTDARQILASDSLKNLVANFADPSVGCVSGNLALEEDSNAASLKGVGIYWRLEKKMRQWEAAAGSSVGATGAFYAARRSLIVNLPVETVLDDVYIPLHIVRQGYRVIFETRAIARDGPTPNAKREFRRKVRTLAGNYQLLVLAPWLITTSNPLRAEFICHKLLRLLVPFALVGVFVSSLWLRTGIYELALISQVIFYASAGLDVFHLKNGIIARLSRVSLAFTVLNGAAALAFLHFITGRKAVWVSHPGEVNADSTITYMDQLITFLAKGAETKGRVAFTEVKIRPGLEPLPHIHEREHEVFFVREGAIRFYTPEKTFDVQAGGVAFLPQGEPHTFTCLTEEIRALIMIEAVGDETVAFDGTLPVMGERAREMLLPHAAITNEVEVSEQAISVGPSWGIHFLTPEDTKKALPLYPGSGVPIS